VGPGGHFLKARETRAFMRAGELHVPDLLLREPYDSWSVKRRDEVDRAVERVDRILAEHRPAPLPEGAAERIGDIIAAAAGGLGGR